MTRKKVSDQALLDSFLRSDFDFFSERCFRTLNPGKPFWRNWHHQAMGYELERIRLEENQRLIINLQPRSLKSLITSVAFPAFVLGHAPDKRIIVISYGGDLADKHARDFRSVVESRWYKRAFPKMRIVRSVEDRIETTRHGVRLSTTVMGALTGLGGDIIILDDPQKAAEVLSESARNKLKTWFSNTLLSRLDDKQKGAIIVVMQRVHDDDLCEHLWETSGDWTTLSLSAIAESDEAIAIGKNEFHRRKTGEALHPEREPLHILEKLRNEIGAYDFAAQFQQSPVPVGGNMIKREWLRYFNSGELPERSAKSTVIQSWDIAAKTGMNNDWSVCTSWLVHADVYYLLDVTRGRYDYPRLREVSIRLAEQYSPDVMLIEDTSTGTALAQDLRDRVKTPISPVSVHGNKVSRLFVEQRKFEAGRVRFPCGATFLPELEAELFAFPRGKHDDQVDSITQALNYEVKRSYAANLDGMCRLYEALLFEPTLRQMADGKGRR